MEIFEQVQPWTSSSKGCLYFLADGMPLLDITIHRDCHDIMALESWLAFSLLGQVDITIHGDCHDLMA
jgi:hypothetical protein